MHPDPNAILSRLRDRYPDNFYDYANEYGEPGYGSSLNPETAVVLGNYWCNDPGCRHATGLHDISAHHPRLFQYLEDAGIQFEWHDEWAVVRDSDSVSRAYRIRPDSYSWQASVLYSESVGDYLTPYNDIEDWIHEVVNNPNRAIPSVVWSEADLINAGFTRYECGYESGWHPGQTDDPHEITRAIRDEYGPETDIVFLIEGTGQFDVQFCAFIRSADGGHMHVFGPVELSRFAGTPHRACQHPGCRVIQLPDL